MISLLGQAVPERKRDGDERTPGAGPAVLSEHELSEIRMLIEERTGIRFDESRERFFSTRVRSTCARRGFDRGTDLLRAMRKSNVEYEALLEASADPGDYVLPVSGCLRSV